MKPLKKLLFSILAFSILLTGCFYDFEQVFNDILTQNDQLNIIASDSYKSLNLENELPINVNIEYMPDIEIVSYLNRNPKSFDSILISNSMWTYMLNNAYLTESKSLAISPVVFAVKESKAKELNLINTEITNADIINLIEEGKIKYTMPSAVRTNVGATSYLGFVNALAGNPQVLTTSHLADESLKTKLTTLFKNVERNSGSELYTFDILQQNNCDALIATEAAIIDYNLKNPSQPLYMLYPTDGVPITDSMFTFIGSADKRDLFITARDYLLSDEGKKIFTDNHYRTWYGGVSDNPGADFKKEWGINTSEVLKVTSFPSKEVMNEAFDLYINSFRKPAAITFVLDYSGSMEGSGLEQLQEATSYILDNNSNSSDYLQFSESDLVNVIYFHRGLIYQTDLVKGDQVSSLLKELETLSAKGGTPLYESTYQALETEISLLKEYGDQYNYSVVLMTDGEPTGYSFSSFEFLRERDGFDKYDIPVYTIAFGQAILSELEQLADLTGGKSFDGRKDLIGAFKEIRGYN